MAVDDDQELSPEEEAVFLEKLKSLFPLAVAMEQAWVSNCVKMGIAVPVAVAVHYAASRAHINLNLEKGFVDSALLKEILRIEKAMAVQTEKLVVFDPDGSISEPTIQ